MIKYARGTVWWARLEEEDDSKETGVVLKNRPVLVMSNNEYNATHATLTVIPITHQYFTDNNIDEFRVPIDTSSPNNKDTSYAMCDQIRLIDKKSLDNYYGVVSSWEMVKVQVAMSNFLHLNDESDVLPADIEGIEI